MLSEHLLYIPSCTVLHVRQWDGEFVVYSEASADTHLLRQPAGLLLESIIRGPKTIQALSVELATEFVGETQEDVLSYIFTTVQSFKELGLLDIQEPA